MGHDTDLVSIVPYNMIAHRLDATYISVQRSAYIPTYRQAVTHVQSKDNTSQANGNDALTSVARRAPPLSTYQRSAEDGRSG